MNACWGLVMGSEFGDHSRICKVATYVEWRGVEYFIVKGVVECMCSKLFLWMCFLCCAMFAGRG